MSYSIYGFRFLQCRGILSPPVSSSVAFAAPATTENRRWMTYWMSSQSKRVSFTMMVWWPLGAHGHSSQPPRPTSGPEEREDVLPGEHRMQRRLAMVKEGVLSSCLRGWCHLFRGVPSHYRIYIEANLPHMLQPRGLDLKLLRIHIHCRIGLGEPTS